MKRERDAEYVRTVLRAHVSVAGSERALARKIGCSPTLLNDTLLGKREPAGEILKFLGLRRQLNYVPV